MGKSGKKLREGFSPSSAFPAIQAGVEAKFCFILQRVVFCLIC